MTLEWKTVSGVSVEYDPTPEESSLLAQLQIALADPERTHDEMIVLLYRRESPLMEQFPFSDRGWVTPRVLANPAYRVACDLLFRKITTEEHLVEIAAQHTMTVTEVAKKFNVHESAVRQAIYCGRLPAWVKEERFYVDPRALGTFKFRSANGGGKR